MIESLRGVLQGRGPGWVVVAVGPVYLRLEVPATVAEELGLPGAEVQLATHLHLREEGLVLYGFLSAPARDLFRRLLSVSGVGPRTALAVLSAGPPEKVAALIAAGDEAALTRIPGVGKKTAGHIIVQLQKLLQQEWQQWGGTAAGVADSDREVVEALAALGYTPTEVRRAVEALGLQSGLPLEERLRRALRALAGS